MAIFKKIGRAIGGAAKKVGSFVKNNAGKIHELAKKHKIGSRLASRFSPQLGTALAAAGYRRGRRSARRGVATPKSARRGLTIPTSYRRGGRRR